MMYGHLTKNYPIKHHDYASAKEAKKILIWQQLADCSCISEGMLPERCEYLKAAMNVSQRRAYLPKKISH
jgi:hypothetical protein